MMSGGSNHSIGLTDEGKCYVWGRMDSNQMGIAIDDLPIDDPTKVLLDERERPRILLEPRTIPDLRFIHCAAASDHNIAISTEGKAYTWGYNGTYQCGQGEVDNVPVATMINNTATRDKLMVWAGAGGQYSLFASNLVDLTTTEPAKSKSKPTSTSTSSSSSSA